MAEYTEGIMGDGAVVLCEGQPVPVQEVGRLLNGPPKPVVKTLNGNTVTMAFKTPAEACRAYDHWGWK